MKYKKEIQFENYKLEFTADTKLNLMSARVYPQSHTNFSYTLFTTRISSIIFHFNFSAGEKDIERIKEELYTFQNELLVKEIIE